MDLFIKLYDQLLKSQSVEVPKEKLIRMKKLIENLLLNKLAKGTATFIAFEVNSND